MINKNLVKILFDKIHARTGLSTSRFHYGAISERAVYYWVGNDFWVAALKDGLWYDLWVGGEADLVAFRLQETWEALHPEIGHPTYPSLRALLEASVEALMEA